MVIQPVNIQASNVLLTQKRLSLKLFFLIATFGKPAMFDDFSGIEATSHPRKAKNGGKK